MKYLERYASKFCNTNIDISSLEFSKLCIVIPCYKESFDDVILSLESLNKSAKLFEKTNVILLVNYRQYDTQEIKKEAQKLYELLITIELEHIYITCSICELLGKKAGVGEARKILMDATFRFYYGYNHNGIIVNLDADTTVPKNYLNSIYSFFVKEEKTTCGSIHFEHSFNATDSQLKGILNYELHLRYFINMQRLIHLPFAFQTIGSAMAVRAFSYAKEGGMPRKQAGEDFYFIHKYSRLNELKDINETMVFPSARISDRVPFGTGKAIGDFMIEELKVTKPIFKTYDFQSFYILEKWIVKLIKNYKEKIDFSLDTISIENETFNQFVIEFKVLNSLLRIQNNSNQFDSFLKGLFAWFDAFLFMKYLHFMRDNSYPDIAIDKALQFLCGKINLDYSKNKQEMLLRLRKYDQQSNYSDQWRADLMTKLSRISAS